MRYEIPEKNFRFSDASRKSGAVRPDNKSVKSNVEINIGHLLFEGAENKTLAAKNLFSDRSVQIFLAAIGENDNKICAEKYSPKRVRHVQIHVHSTPAWKLFNSVAIPNVMSTTFCRSLLL